MRCVKLGALGVCSVTCLPGAGMLILTALVCMVTSLGSIGRLYACFLCFGSCSSGDKSTGASFSPAALQNRIEEVATSCIWPGCTALGTFDHFAWCCPCRPHDVTIPPKPGEMLSSRFVWAVAGTDVNSMLVQSWLVHVQTSLWSHVHSD